MEHDIVSDSATSPLNEQDLRLIAAVKGAFQISWQKNQSPDIEEYLKKCPEPLRPAALAELMTLDIGFRRAAGAACSLTDYTTRFPGYLETVSKLFDQLQSSDTQPTCEATLIEASSAVDDDVPLNKNPEGHKRKSDGSDDLKEVPKQFGRYRILSELGRGGMGAVFQALDGELDRKVALKIPFFKEDDEKEAVQRFYREAKAMAVVQHANLCPVFDVGRFGEWHFLTMAFIDGQPLSNMLKDSNFLSVTQAATLMKTVAVAVQKAHEAGIVHRDLKPANIMLTKDGDPIIMDFGLARRKSTGEADLTQTGAVFGSPAYMAPEQVEARHDEIGPATDVYALGVILYQMVTGHRPFQGSVASIFGQIVSNVPAPPSKWRQGLPPELDAICLKALAKSPANRHASAAKFAEELSYLVNPAGSDVKTISYHTRPDVESAAGAEAESTSNNRSRRDAELRQVTVAVFNYESDGDEGSISMNRASMSSQSEMLHEQSQSFAAFVTEQAAELGGVTVQGTGQEVLTCFGFPQAFEDAPHRAIRAALQVMRKLAVADPKGVKLPPASQVWVVLHSGEAVAEVSEGSQGPSVSLVGEARNTALRLSAIVEPGTVVVSTATHARVALYFECESLGTQRVRGISQPVELFKVNKEAASRNRVELVDPGNLSPLVGRNTELAILKDRWEQAQDSLGQIVLLIGDAGLGKSRLIRELREHVIDSDTEDAAVIEWRCAQHQQGTSFFPVIEFLTRLFDFENLSAADRLETVVRYLREWKIESAENVALLCGLLGVATDSRFPALALPPQKVKERTEKLLLQWLKQMVEISPMLFIVEDLHWLDPSTLELLEKHVSEFETGRMLSILTFRPEFETPWKSKPHQTQIALSRLTKRQIGEMMRKRTKRSDIPEPILQQVIERTDGIPLFVEEFTVVILESGILDRPDINEENSSLLNVIPATLRDLLLSRLDRMAADREVIQLASTIGREFSFSLLSAACTLPENQLLGELDKLLSAGILFKKGEGSDASYIFNHALLQDAAYRSMLTKRRQSCHQNIAQALELHFTDIVHAQPALLAHHYTEAGITEKAIDYWMKAGQKSQEQSANIEAIQHFEKGLAQTMLLPESSERDVLELNLKLPLTGALMAVQGYAAKEVEPVQNRCIEICRQLGEGSPLFLVMFTNWEWLFIRGRFADCFRRCDELLALAKEKQGPGMMGEARWALTCTSFYAGDFASAHDHAVIGSQNHHREASIEFAKITQQNSGSLNLIFLGSSLWQLGFADQGLSWSLKALDLTLDLKHAFTEAMIYWQIAQVYDFAGMGDKTIEYGERCLKIADEQGFVFWAALGTACVGVGLKHLGRYDEAIEALQKALVQVEATGSFILFTKYRAHLADSLWQSGQRDAAVKQLDQAFADQSGGELFMHSELLRIRGDFQFDKGDLDAAEATYGESLAVARKQSAKFYELRTMVHLCRIWQKRGDIGGLKQNLEPLYNWFTEGFEMPDLKAARKLLEGLST